MSPTTYSALPLAHAGLRILMLVNGIYGAAVLAILIALLAAAAWTLSALGIPPAEQSGALVTGMRAIAAFGLAAVPLNFAVLQRMAAIVQTVRAGDPFIAANASRLQAIAWLLVGLQLLGIVIGFVGQAVSTPHHPLHLDAGFSPGGWLAVLLTFVLARVFAEGARMREDLHGTI